MMFLTKTFQFNYLTLIITMKYKLKKKKRIESFPHSWWAKTDRIINPVSTHAYLRLKSIRSNIFRSSFSHQGKKKKKKQMLKNPQPKKEKKKKYIWVIFLLLLLRRTLDRSEWEREEMENAAAAPTVCYKCVRPGH